MAAFGPCARTAGRRRTPPGFAAPRLRSHLSPRATPPPGKVVDRHWYERNKHIFPASRWETYDPEKTWDTYTTHGHEVQ